MAGEVLEIENNKSRDKAKSIALMIPARGMIDVRFMYKYVQTILALGKTYEMFFFFCDDILLDRARNKMLEMAMNCNSGKGADYYLFVDADMDISARAVNRLVESMEKGFVDPKTNEVKPIELISGVYFQRVAPYTPVYRVWREDKGCFFTPDKVLNFNEVMPVDAFGFGIVIAKDSCLRKIYEQDQAPPFDFGSLKDKEGKMHDLSEDLYFCVRAKRAGVQPYLDSSVVVGHYGGTVNEAHYISHLLLTQNLYNRKNAVDMLVEFTGLTPEVVNVNLKEGTQRLKEEWEAKAPKTPEEIKAFYKESEWYVYDLVNWHTQGRGKFDADVVRTLKQEGVRTILDYGSGSGDLAVLAAMNGITVYAMDYENKAFEFSKFRARKHELEDMIIHLDLETQKDYFEKHKEVKIDAITCFDVIEHMSNEQEVKDTVLWMKKLTPMIIASVSFGTQGGIHPMHMDASDDLKQWLKKEIGEDAFESI